MDTDDKFLNDLVKILNINGKVRLIFLVRFSRRNQNIEDTDLIDRIWEPEEINEPLKTMRQHLREIYPSLETKLECPPHPEGNHRGRLKGDIPKFSHYYGWIWETKYAEYLAAQPQVTESSNRNPFGDTGRIEDPNRLFGRGEFLRRLEEDLSHGTSISLVGESQIGKSSILRYLCQRGKHQWGGKTSQFVYMDLQLINHDEDFYLALCHELKIDPPCSMFQLARQLNRRGHKYILCLDEIEVLGGEKFSFDVRTNLRGLADGNDTPLILVTVSRSPLRILFPDLPEKSSPLAHFCQQRDVLPFTESETIDFIHHRLQPTGVKFSDDQIAEIYQQTNGRPAKLQQAAKDLFDTMQKPPSS